jgi:hypothetical protein
MRSRLVAGGPQKFWFLFFKLLFFFVFFYGLDVNIKNKFKKIKKILFYYISKQKIFWKITNIIMMSNTILLNVPKLGFLFVAAV